MASREVDELRYKMYGKRRSLRLPDWDYCLPAVYHVTCACYGRNPWFKVPSHAGACVDALRQQVARTAFQIHAFCIMPDHIHVLCQPDPHHPSSLITFVGQVKRETTRRLHLLGVEDLVWQRGFYDHILRRDEDALPVIWYILANPVRSGLVEDYEAYPYSFAPEFKTYSGPRDVVSVPDSKPSRKIGEWRREGAF